MTYHTCPDCRANLDPGERCDCKDKAVRFLNSLRRLQETPEAGCVLPCPRCGRERMTADPALNALSRHENVYVCSECGRDEALRDVSGMPPLPLREWGMIKAFI